MGAVFKIVPASCLKFWRRFLRSGLSAGWCEDGTDDERTRFIQSGAINNPYVGIRVREKLNDYRLSHVLLMRQMADLSGNSHFRFCG